jgi:hypothetical protein
MEQRSLRLGDVVDDYCPRERRITNHAIVAIVEDAIRRTRCTTCDHEHEYKEAREPRRRRKAEGALFNDVLAEVTGAQLVAPARGVPVPSEPEHAAPVTAAAQAAASTFEMEAASQPPPPEDGWPAHRTLIRATLPRVDGEPPPPRPIPEFTMHQKPQPARGRGFRFRAPQDPFGQSRDGRGNHAPHGERWSRARPANPNGNANGNVDHGNGNAPGKGRGRGRRRGKRH